MNQQHKYYIWHVSEIFSVNYFIFFLKLSRVRDYHWYRASLAVNDAWLTGHQPGIISFSLTTRDAHLTNHNRTFQIMIEE